MRSMGLSSRLLLIPADGSLCRLADADFDRLYNRAYSGSGAWRVPALSGQRVRWASLVVELFDRQPVRVVHRTYAYLHFDEKGRLDVDRMNREQVARMDVAFAPVLAHSTDATDETVIHASSRFAARGGSWKPPAELKARLDAAALGQAPCPRIKLVPVPS
jgi:hypothetical protein